MIDYEIIYSKRRTISIIVKKDGSVLFRAPYHTPKSKFEKLIIEHNDWIIKHQKRAIERTQADAKLTDEIIKILKKEAKERLIPMTEYFASILGVAYGKITITSAKTRFGSCSSKGNISYSFLLMQYPVQAQEYVVVHELCHRIHMDHSPAFYKKIESVLPDYKERKKLLKNIPK